MRVRVGRTVAGGLAVLAVTAAVLTAPSATAQDDYYAGTEGLSGEQLKTKLHEIISTGAEALSYSEVWTGLQATDEDPANPNNVILVYSGQSRPKNANGGDQGDWNREHVWAKSHGDVGTSPGPGTDLHHLRPEDVQVNAIRDNKDFDLGGSAVDGAPGNNTDGDSFEPRDEVKGDVARMILFMTVRYEGTDGYADLEPNERVGNESAPFMGKLSVLTQWHEADPPSDFEKNRNEIIFTDFQHNRNPFIDHPEWVASIWP